MLGSIALTDMHKHLDTASKEASDLCWRELCMVCWYDVFDDPNAEVGKDPSDTVLLPRLGSELD